MDTTGIEAQLISRIAAIKAKARYVPTGQVDRLGNSNLYHVYLAEEARTPQATLEQHMGSVGLMSGGFGWSERGGWYVRVAWCEG